MPRSAAAAAAAADAAAADERRFRRSEGSARPIDVARLPTRARSTANPQRCEEAAKPAVQGAGRDIPQTQRPPLQAGRSTASLNEELKNRLKQLHLRKDDGKQNSKIVEELGDIILNTLKESYPYSFHWDKLNSGSYYDKTKVRYS